MSLFDLPIDEAQEPSIVPEGEYELNIYSAEEQTSRKSGRPMIQCIMSNLTSPNAQRVYHYLTGLLPDDDAQTRNGILLAGKRFCKAFGLVPPLSPDEMAGHTGRVLLSVEEDNNGVPRNRIARFL